MKAPIKPETIGLQKVRGFPLLDGPPVMDNAG